ncbi:hypothetical protein TYRP_011234 [Tyrophagus putrescentiae]|nr:hypothetical protein TYRP_011234 [Tyrophagus putrescentiae]
MAISWHTDSRRQVYLKHTLIGVAHPFHVEFLFFICSLNYLAVALPPRLYRREHFGWLELLLLLKGPQKQQQRPKLDFVNNGYSTNITTDFAFSHFETATTLQRQAKRALRLVHFIVLFNTVRVGVSFSSVALASYYPNAAHLTAAALWQLLYLLFVVNLSSVLYTTVTYLCLLCAVLRLRLKAFDVHSFEIRFHQVDGILRLARQYNAFWRHLLSNTIFLRVWIINFVLYLVLFANIASRSFRAVYTLIALFEATTFALVTIQAARVASASKRAAARLRRCLYLGRHLNLPSVEVKLKLQNQCHLLESATDVGLCLSNGVLVTQALVGHIVRECSSYFFLFTMLSLNYQVTKEE